MDRCRWHRHVRGNGDVVVADDGHVRTGTQSEFPQDPDDADRGSVIDGEDGRGARIELEECRACSVASSTQSRPPAFDLHSVRDLPPVDVIAAYPGSDGSLMDAAVAAGARGVVVQALGAGNASPEMTATVARLVDRGIPVLVCTRAFSGPVIPLYTAGGGADLERSGAVFGSDLSPWQARLLLSVAITSKPEDPGTVVRQWLRQATPAGG
ncbi:hypothetical protein [Streptomyces sp. NPDC092129]|uniref:hypothetical protein n=1 Tax=Streptomyces sp. NPDC092129 TaxID=3366010 RepID=UPI00382FEDB8